ncbi:MAG: NUDIX domain-containing protein [Bacilli bacterium]|nr:NUDIX domain-containing protein [Bacilli bacterium]
MILKNMAGIYILDGDKILLLKRSKTESLNEYYSIGGRFEPDELNNPFRCVMRELEEESGLLESHLTDIKLKYVSFRNYGNYITQNYLFFAKLKDKDIILKDCDEGTFEWVNIEDLFSKKMPPTSFACLKHYFSNEEKNDSILMAAATNNNGYGEYIFTELVSFDNFNFDKE